MCLGKDMVQEIFIFKDFIFNNSSEGKILGIITDNKLTFKSHIKILCKKVAKKIGALSRVSSNLSYSHKILYFSSVIQSLPSYIDFYSVTIMILVIIIETSKF